MKLSKKIIDIEPSSTVILGQKARELISSGKDVIQLGEGEPDFNTPDHIIEASYKAMKRGETKYTNVAGTQELRNEIKKYLKNEHQLIYQEDQIVVGNGGKQLIFNALLASIDPEDEVIIPTPYWVSYPQIVNFAGGKSILANCTESNDFKISPKLLEKHINKKTLWLILNSPGNPTGSVYSKQELHDLAIVLRNHTNVNIICDDIYSKIIYGNEKFFTLAEVAPDLIDRILIINGLSKAYAMTGWRIGYAAGPKDIIKAIGKIQSQSTSNPSSVSQAAAVEALNGTQDFIQERSDAFKKRRDFVVKSLNDIKGISCLRPNGAFYVFPSCKGLLNKKTKLKTDTDFVQKLLEKENVAVVQGSAFGLEGYFRISYATSMENLQKAMDRIRSFCENLN